MPGQGYSILSICHSIWSDSFIYAINPLKDTLIIVAKVLPSSAQPKPQLAEISLFPSFSPPSQATTGTGIQVPVCQNWIWIFKFRFQYERIGFSMLKFRFRSKEPGLGHSNSGINQNLPELEGRLEKHAQNELIQPEYHYKNYL